MDDFEYREGSLWCEAVRAAQIAERFGTPVYVYSQRTLLGHYERVRQAFAALNPLICFSIKACQNVHLCRLLAQEGCGFDVVSGGELYRALRAGADPRRIVFAGVGKTEREIREALQAGVGLLNAESASELEELEQIAGGLGCRPRVALRVNPDVDPQTHEYTATGRRQTKFGVDIEQAGPLFERFARGRLMLCGLHLHIGSPVNSTEPYRLALERVLRLIAELRQAGYEVDTLDIGGGFGAHYQGSEAPPARAYADVIVPLLDGQGLKVILEPGRCIAANAGILLTRVLHVKESGGRRFVVVDAAMTELIRPALYGAYHFIWPAENVAQVPATRAADPSLPGVAPCDVVGPVCESGDFLARGRPLPPLRRGDLLAVFTTGAYGITMSSQYNSRPRCPEVLVRGADVRQIRRREEYRDLLAAEEDGV